METAASAAMQSRSRMRRNAGIDIRSWLVAPAVAVLIVAFVYPVFQFLLRSFSIRSGAYRTSGP